MYSSLYYHLYKHCKIIVSYRHIRVFLSQRSKKEEEDREEDEQYISPTYRSCHSIAITRQLSF